MSLLRSLFSLAACALVLLSCASHEAAVVPMDASGHTLSLARPAAICLADISPMPEDQLRQATPKGMQPYRLSYAETGRIANGLWRSLSGKLAAEKLDGMTVTGDRASADYTLTISMAAFEPGHAPGPSQQAAASSVSGTPFERSRGGAQNPQPHGSGRGLDIKAYYYFQDRNGQTVWSGISSVSERLPALSKSNVLEDLGARYGQELFAMLRQSSTSASAPAPAAQ